MKSRFKIILGILAALILVIFAFGFAVNYKSSKSSTAAAEYKKISPAEAKEIIDTNPDAILLDVRTDTEFEESHIPGAILLPDFDVASKAEETLADKNALILVYCRTGRRSANAAKELLEMGYTNVYDFGGIVDWPYEKA